MISRIIEAIKNIFVYKYEYYVITNAHNKRGISITNSCVISRNRKIRTLEDVVAITRDIVETNDFADAKIVNWKRLR